MAIKAHIIAPAVGADMTFINGSLHPPGAVVHVDMDELHGETKADSSTTPNLLPLSKSAAAAGIEQVAIASIAPTGPNPTAPQSLPPGTVQQGEAFIAPGVDGGPATQAVAEGSTEDVKRRGK